MATAVRNRGHLKGGITMYDLAAELEVCHKTVHRDLEFLRDLGAPVYFNHTLKTWIWNLTEDVPWYFGGTIQSPRLNLNTTETTTFTISHDGRSITCWRCNRTSYHPKDVEEHYCGHCQVFHDDLTSKEKAEILKR